MGRRGIVWVAVVVIAAAAGFVVRSLMGGEPAVAVSEPAAAHVVASDPVAAGRYLVTVAGCNDCHTPGWAEQNGEVDESLWLTGVPVGFRGPWGTTYAGNLRRTITAMDEDTWVNFARTWHARPPMPSVNVNRMSEPDLRAIYRFVSTLKPLGEHVPTALGPDAVPVTPYIDFVPKVAE